VKQAHNYLMVRFATLLALLLAVPHVSLAQGRTVQWYLGSITIFINETVLPLFFAVAILFLFVNVTRYFVIDATDAYKREEARKYILYAIIALVFITSIWGVINLVTSAFNIGNNVPICPDYIESGSAGCSTPSPVGRSNNYGFTNNPLGEFGY